MPRHSPRAAIGTHRQLARSLHREQLAGELGIETSTAVDVLQQFSTLALAELGDVAAEADQLLAEEDLMQPRPPLNYEPKLSVTEKPPGWQPPVDPKLKQLRPIRRGLLARIRAWRDSRKL